MPPTTILSQAVDPEKVRETEEGMKEREDQIKQLTAAHKHLQLWASGMGSQYSPEIALQSTTPFSQADPGADSMSMTPGFSHADTGAAFRTPSMAATSAAPDPMVLASQTTAEAHKRKEPSGTKTPEAPTSPSQAEAGTPPKSKWSPIALVTSVQRSGMVPRKHSLSTPMQDQSHPTAH
mmetsp:Transcript_44388/g.80989  ORF Transcript_44388/g.80989 Transcript_44388/m.80989 type:complete len:179 (+) Transcript_44388:296-832(+)